MWIDKQLYNKSKMCAKIQIYKYFEVKYKGKKKVLNHVIKYNENFTYPNS